MSNKDIQDTGSLPLILQGTAMNLQVCSLQPAGQLSASANLQPVSFSLGCWGVKLRPSHLQSKHSLSPTDLQNSPKLLLEWQLYWPARGLCRERHLLTSLTAWVQSVEPTQQTDRANSLKCTDLHTYAVGPFYTHIQMPKIFKFSKDKFLYKLKNLKTLSLCIFKCSQSIDNYPLRVWDCSLVVKQVFTICEATRLIPTSI